MDDPDPDAVAAAIEPRTRLVLVETPANPTLALTDIAAIARVCRQAGIPLAVDNTFLTAALQRPLDLGADLTVTSTESGTLSHYALDADGALTLVDGAAQTPRSGRLADARGAGPPRLVGFHSR